MTNPPLTTLGVKIRDHLKEHRPRLAKELEKAVTLDQTSASLTGSSGRGVRRGEEQRPGARPSTGGRSGRVGLPGRGGRAGPLTLSPDWLLEQAGSPESH